MRHSFPSLYQEPKKQTLATLKFTQIMYTPKSMLTKRITVSIEECLRDDLDFLTDELNINRSSLVRQLLLDWMVSRKLLFQTAEKRPSSQPIKDAIGYSIGDE